MMQQPIISSIKVCIKGCQASLAHC